MKEVANLGLNENDEVRKKKNNSWLNEEEKESHIKENLSTDAVGWWSKYWIGEDFVQKLLISSFQK